MRSFDFEYLVEERPMLLPDASVGMTRRDLEAPDAGLDEAGFYHAGILRRGVRQWEFSYKVLTGEEYRYLLELLSGCFSFRFRGTDGQPEQALCRAEGIRAEFFDRPNDIYKNVGFTVKEC